MVVCEKRVIEKTKPKRDRDSLWGILERTIRTNIVKLLLMSVGYNLKLSLVVFILAMTKIAIST